MLLRIASTTLFLATNMPSVYSFPKFLKCDRNEYLAQLDSFRNDVKVEGMDPSIVSSGFHELHDQHLVDDDSPTCMQKASQVMREFSKVVMKEDHPMVVATEKVLGKDNAHCFQSGLLILDAVHKSTGEEVPLDTIVFPNAEDEGGIEELCGGLRQQALVNWATFVPPNNLPSGYVLTYSAVVSIDGEDCCGDSDAPLPLLHAQFTVEMGRYKSDKAGKGSSKGAKHTKASEKDPKASKKERALVERRLCA